MAKSLMNSIRAEMGKQDEKRGLAKLLENVQEVQQVQEATTELLIHKVQEVQDVQEVAAEPLIHEAQEDEGRRTQGKKGAKLPRAHISLSPAMYKHLRIASASTGKTMSEYVEELLRADKEKTPARINAEG